METAPAGSLPPARHRQAFVFLLSDANLERYGIRPEQLARELTAEPKVGRRPTAWPANRVAGKPRGRLTAWLHAPANALAARSAQREWCMAARMAHDEQIIAEHIPRRVA
eukprot:5927706-Prymnesium_polylepis.1